MKFIHIADVHLGAVPDLGFLWSKRREKEIRETFVRMIQQVKKEKTELLLVAGDLFHGQPLLRECKELNYLFEQIPDTAVVLIAGNHDYIRKDSAYLKMKWAKNVIGLWGENCQTCYIKSCNTYVYGLSYHGRERTDAVYNRLFPGGGVNLQKGVPGACHILLAHGGDDKHIPIQFSALGKAGFNYVALGHIHQPQILAENAMAYCGSLEPVDRTHIGPRGYISGEIADGKTTIRFVPFACAEYKTIEVTVTSEDTNGSIRSRIMQRLAEEPEQVICRIELAGIRDDQLEIETEDLYKLGNIVEVIDKTEPEYDFARIRRQYTGTAIAAYIDSFQGDLSETEKRALYFGVQALMEE